MSYQVIARKWRPQAFEEVTGQDHVTRTLRNAIEFERLHHSYIFSGARGVGKTTTARLLAKALNCHKSEDKDKPNPTPCRIGDKDICPSCLEISESRSIDVLEFDAASNTQVEKIRDIILDGINIGTSRDRNKIFIIDEVHMLSNSSFNALLKTIEEPPMNVMFIMATTELHKVPDTIRSRSQEFVFRTIPQPQIYDRLRLIADAEQVEIAPEALQIIARSGEGSMRDAQSNFDQVISFSGNMIGEEDVSTALGLASSEVIEKIVSSLALGESKIALEVVAGLVDAGQDLRAFCRDVLAVLRDLLIFKVSGGRASLVESSTLSTEALKAQAERFTEADLVRFFHSLAETETGLKEAVNGRYLLEVGLVKLIEMRGVRPIEELLERLAALEGGVGTAATPPTAKPENEPLAAAAPEKKTLKSEAGVEPADTSAKIEANDGSELPSWNDVGGVAPEDEPHTEPNDEPSDLVPAAPTAIIADEAYLASLPVKLPPISSEDLQHFDDKRLDTDFERKLVVIGDNLLPIANAAKIAHLAVDTAQLGAASFAAVANGSGGTSPRVLNISVPSFEDDIPQEIPVLPQNPTEADLFAYANAHPNVVRAIRIFRAKVTGVERKTVES